MLESGDAEAVELLAQNPDLVGDELAALQLAVEFGHDKIVAHLLTQNPRLVDTKPRGWNMLHLAAQQGHDKVVGQLLAYNPALVYTRDLDDQTALTIAIEHGHDQVVTQLLAQGSELSQPLQGKTELQLAARRGYDKIVTKLIAAGPSLVTAVDPQRRTALHWAAFAGHDRVVAQLLAHNPKLIEAISNNNMTALHFAAERGHANVVALLLAHQLALIDAVDFYGNTALHLAAKQGHVEVVEELLAHKPLNETGMRPAFTEKNYRGWTPLHLAAKGGFEEIVGQLLVPEMVRHVDPKGNTVLHYLIGLPFSQELIHRAWAMDAEAVHAVNSDFLTPFDFALGAANEWAIGLLRGRLSIDDLGRACGRTKTSFERFRPLIEQQCEPLLVALHQDLLGTVYEYLDPDNLKRNNKRPRNKLEHQPTSQPANHHP